MSATDGQASMTPTEAALAPIWAEILRRDPVAPGDDFFELGGSSLHAVRMAALVYEQLGLEVPLQRLFETRTLAAFARALDESGTGAVEEGVI